MIRKRLHDPKLVNPEVVKPAPPAAPDLRPAWAVIRDQQAAPPATLSDLPDKQDALYEQILTSVCLIGGLGNPQALEARIAHDDCAAEIQRLCVRLASVLYRHR